MRVSSSSVARAALLGLALAGCGSLGTHTLRPYALGRAPQPAPRGWDEVFAHPTALRVTGFNTGEVFVGASVLIEANNPATPAAARREQWVPALAYLVEHPTEGRMLFDAGVGSAEPGGECAFGRRPFFWVPCRARPEQLVLAQLHAHGVRASELRFVALSHFHGDHSGGLRSLEAEAPVPVLTTASEWSAVDRSGRLFDGYFHELLEGTYPIFTLPPEGAVEMPYVGRVFNLLGDGSVWMMPTTGHTRGHFSLLLNATAGPILLTFDASHLAANLEHNVPPGFVVDRPAAVATLARLRALRAAYPTMRVYYGHEPSQWAGQPSAVVLAQ